MRLESEVRKVRETFRSASFSSSLLTSELLANYVWDELVPKLSMKDSQVTVQVWESEKSYGAYNEAN